MKAISEILTTDNACGRNKFNAVYLNKKIISMEK